MKKTLIHLLNFALGTAGLFSLVVRNHRALGLFRGNTAPVPNDAVTVMLEILIGLASLYLVSRLVLYAVTLRTQPSPAIVTLLDRGLVRLAWDVYRQRLSQLQRKVFSLSAWSVFVYVLVRILFGFDALDKSEMILLNWMPIRGHIISSSYSKIPPGNWVKQNIVDEPVRLFRFATEDNNFTKYYRDLYFLARDLKRAGAKVIVAEWPDQSLPGLVNEYRPELTTLRTRIDSLGIVIWTQTVWGTAFAHYPSHDRIRIDSTMVYPVFSVKKDIEKIGYLPLMLPAVISWQPLRRSDIPQLFIYYPDAAIMAARKYFDIPDTCAVTTEENRITIGNLTIPVSTSGFAYSEFMFPPFASQPVIACRGSVMIDGYKLHSDGLRYHALYVPGREERAQTAADTVVENLMAYRSFYEGKAVVINWMPNHRPDEFFAKIHEANVLSSVLKRSFYVKLDWLTHVLVALPIVLIALASAFVRRSRTVLYVSMLLAAAIGAGAVWSILSLHVLFEPVYPLISCAVSGIIFLLLKMSREAMPR